MALTPETEKLAADWFRRVRESQRVHYACGNRYSHFSYWLGVPSIVLSAIVGTAIFASLDKEANTNLKILLGMVSILSAVFTSLQTFTGFGKRADLHRSTGAAYGAVRRKLELLKTLSPSDPVEIEKALLAIKEDLDRIATNSPDVPAAIKFRIDKELKERGHSRIFELRPEKAGEAPIT